MTIDSHQHFWKYDRVKDSWITDAMAVLKRNFMPSDLEPILVTNGIDGCVAIQAAQSEAETEFLLALAEENDFIKGVVGWIDFRAKDLEDRLSYFSKFKKLKGFRHITQAEPRGFMTEKLFIEGINRLQDYNFTYDLLITHDQLDEALKFVSSVNSVQVVVDHLAKPSIRTKEKTHWELNMAALATFKNVSCKISGMVTEAEWHSWSREDFTPYLDELLEAFGADRLMYGSDWPVCLLSASYAQQLEIVQQYISKLSLNERQKIMGLNAVNFYKLN
jgi:L-fuconolactonase